MVRITRAKHRRTAAKKCRHLFQLGVANSRWAVHCRSLEHEHATQLALERCRADAAKRHAAELVQGGAGTAVELERGGAETAAELGRGGAETAAELGWGGAETAVEPGRGGASGGAETTAELGRGGAETAAELAETQRRLKHAQVGARRGATGRDARPG